ncbi:F0F1 ATP synthase subunit delta [Microbacterium sp. M3]|uniref:ATP synthase subunit delta n=1 Tax=Microbacterium arthrosphaerae TaxID=792652 RepID=A0ABU4H5P4_9MICO|nr:MULTISPECIES: F0F1 ATP synthase subunit delta [Microbacterium]MDW4573214.1 F0F1 ATP synthase subunit delta [Microbacterium arthrosphaerae]MDW7607069.1 F0F1 ATP synthase subunit delta [Microbacterium sp. M3]
MGSATTQALAATTTALGAASGVDLDVARELFAVARAVGDSSQLSGALADSAAPAEARRQVVAGVFGTAVKPTTASLLTTAVAQRWSSADDLVDGIEELAVRAAAVADPASDVEAELFSFSRTVAGNAELELALGSRLGDAAAKGALVESLLNGRASAATTLIAASLVRQPRERRVRQLLSRATRIVADQRNRAVATVVVAAPLSAGQSERLTAALSKRYGTPVSLNTIVDPTVVGGLRVQIADDVIDASVSSRLADLRQRLAG